MKKIVIFMFLLVLLGCGGLDDSEQSTVNSGQSTVDSEQWTVDSEVTPVYVTFGGHIEDNAMYRNCDVFEEKKEGLLKVAEMAEEYDVPFNLQASYEWFQGVSKCDDERNIMDVLAEDYGFEIDVHQEGASEDDVTSGNNMADIRFIAETVTSYVTEISGFQWDNVEQYDRFQYGEDGLLHDITWFPEILVGGVSVDHTNGDFSRDMTSMGVWIPSGFTEEEFHVHDQSDDARMVYVGSGPNQFVSDWAPSRKCHFESSIDFVETVVDYLDDGRIEAGKIYTYTMFIPQSIMFDDDEREKMRDLMEGFSSLAEEGVVELKHFTEVVEVWMDEYDSEPNIFTYDHIDPADYTCK